MSHSNYNPIPREVYCTKCKQYTIRDDPNPKCSICFERLITVIKSLLTGERITK